MKKSHNTIMFILSLFSVLLLSSCGGGTTNNNSTPSSEVMDGLDPADIVETATFQGANNYNVSGNVELYFTPSTNMYSLVVNNFSTDNGPDLRVYIAQGTTTANFLNLGDLTATSGALRYDFSASQYQSVFDHVLIWCDAVKDNFGTASLAP